ncbi:hypothetical protein HK098_005302 [Nowakowskiella sp. JEL0407]|nr:hypothetical protein HK098_005302 [Nowakowskiella sp. JEL0407]
MAKTDKKRWESPAEVWAKWQAVTCGALLINGGIWSFFYPWPLVPEIQSALPFFYKPISIPGIAAILFGIFVLMLELSSSLEKLNRSFRFIPKAILYAVFAGFSVLQFTCILPAQFMVITIITLLVASTQEEPSPLPTMK